MLNAFLILVAVVSGYWLLKRVFMAGKCTKKCNGNCASCPMLSGKSVLYKKLDFKK